MRTLLESITGARTVPPDELQRAADSFASALQHAGSDRPLLLDAVDELERVERALRSVAAQHRHASGSTHAVEQAEKAMQLAASVRFAARPTGRYLPAQYLRDQLWRVVRSVERARIALQWAQAPSGAR